MRLLAGWVIALDLLAGLKGSARADAPLSMDEPTSGLHLEIEGGCQVRPADGGGAACRDFAASADESERFAVVLGPKGLLLYSVAMFAEREQGVGVSRARLVSTKMGEAVVGTPAEVTYGGQRFLRTQLRTSNGAAICFITADESAEIAIIMFASDPEAFAAMEPRAETAMRTLRRSTRQVAAASPMSCGSEALLSMFLFVVFGLPAVGFILRAVRVVRGVPSKKVHVDEPHGPRPR
jgi:hypothetical protein